MSVADRFCGLRRSSLLFEDEGVYSVKLDCLNSNCDEVVETGSGSWLAVPYHNRCRILSSFIIEKRERGEQTSPDSILDRS